MGKRAATQQEIGEPQKKEKHGMKEVCNAEPGAGGEMTKKFKQKLI